MGSFEILVKKEGWWKAVCAVAPALLFTLRVHGFWMQFFMQYRPERNKK
jgi:hypothetical protein